MISRPQATSRWLPLGRWQLVFNGEIYNHVTTRRTLRPGSAAAPFTFRGTSDSEVLLGWLIRHGAAGLHNLRGMFAFASMTDWIAQHFWAAIPTASSPSISGRVNGELALHPSYGLASGLPSRTLNTTALSAFLATGSVPEPTLVAGIERLPAGCCTLAGRSAEDSAMAAIARVPGRRGHRILGTEAAAIATRDALEDSVAAHLIADVQVGLFLSGGLDSSALLAWLLVVCTFTIGFAGAAASAGFDESSPAANLAAHFGATPRLL